MTGLLITLFFLAASPQEPLDTAAVHDIFSEMPEGVTIEQSDAVKAAMNTYTNRNRRRAQAGYTTQQAYRIRIFFDNGQNARAASAAAADRFRERHPGVSVHRSFTSPFFKVTVGNYSTKTEAQNALKSIQRDFPSAFIVRDNTKDE